VNNIRFSYLYRDGSNFKSWGEVIFSNPEGLAVNEIETKLIRAFLPDKLPFQKSFYLQMESLQNTITVTMSLIVLRFAKKNLPMNQNIQLLNS
jgi:hypothetical protein